MKRNRLSMLGAGFAMALAGLMGTAQAAQPTLVTSHNISEIKATRELKIERAAIEINNTGGLDFPPVHFDDYGMSPKEYGMKYGRGNAKGKSNRLRLSHNAKLKRK